MAELEEKKVLEPVHGTSQTRLMMSLMKGNDVGGEVDSLSGEPSLLDQERIRMSIEASLIAKLKAPTAFRLVDVLPSIAQGVELIAQDDFSKCFRENNPDPWNWNAYLYVLWIMGVIFRYGILLPLRTLSLLTGFLLFGLGFVLVRFVYQHDKQQKQRWERRLIRFLAGSFVFSWHGVIRYHGVIPKRAPNQIYVANHTSMIDVGLFVFLKFVDDLCCSVDCLAANEYLLSRWSEAPWMGWISANRSAGLSWLYMVQ
jgi:hypothetical protein